MDAEVEGVNIAVFFGGKSCEHNISIITGMQVMQALKGQHHAVPVYIDKEGVFWTGKDLDRLQGVKKGAKVHKTRVTLQPSSQCLYSLKGKTIIKIDAAVLATHGFGGEDGCLQGLLTLAGIPYTGSGVLASALGMNKIYMKKVFEREFLPVLPYVSFTSGEYRADLFSVVERIKTTLRFPMIVKPASAGSSIGISVAHSFPELFEAVSAAFLWDNAAVVENALPAGFTELNCAAIGVGADVVCSEIEQPVSAAEFLTFADKYVQKNKGMRKNFPAKISEGLAEKVKSYTRRAFMAIGAAGVSRVDFLCDGESLFVNEINTIPGALSNHLFSCGSERMTFADLLDRLIVIAIKVKQEADGLTYVYQPAYELTGK